MRPRVYSIAIGLLCAFVISAPAATIKIGQINDEIWTKAESPYLVLGDLQVVNLSIGPGVEILVSNAVIEVQGFLNARGTAAEPIVFRRALAATPWHGIFFNYSPPGSVLEHCAIGGSVSSAVRCISSGPVLRSCVVTNNSGTAGGGIWSQGGPVTVSNTVFDRNSATTGPGGATFVAGGPLTVLNCYLTRNSAMGDGGGVFLEGGNLIVSNSVFNGNGALAGSGGAVFALNAGESTFANCNVTSNAAAGAGGGVYLAATTINISASLIEANEANDHGGGAFLSARNILISQCEFEENNSRRTGGGVYVRAGSGADGCTIVNTVISGNSSRIHAGGLFGSGNVRMQETHIYRNISDGRAIPGGAQGAGAHFYLANVLFERCSFIENRGIAEIHDISGSGIYIRNSDLSMNNCVVADNVAQTSGDATAYGSGIFGHFLPGWPGTVGITNCVIRGNTAASPNCGAVEWLDIGAWVVNTSIAHNRTPRAVVSSSTSYLLNSITFFNGSGGTQLAGDVRASFCNVQNGAPGVSNINVNPIFVSQTNLQLHPSSPCIDRGSTNAQYNDTCFPPSRGTERNDLGAFGGPLACDWVTGEEPIVFVQPKSQTSCLGQTVTLSVRAGGAPPLVYQWFQGPTLLVGQTSSNLTFVNLQKQHSGAYTVVVSNQFGVAMSDPATLVVFDACVGIEMYAGLSITGIVGGRYVLSQTSNVSQTNSWTPLATNLFSTPNWFYLDLDSPLNPRRFYRVDLVP